MPTACRPLRRNAPAAALMTALEAGAGPPENRMPTRWLLLSFLVCLTRTGSTGRSPGSSRRGPCNARHGAGIPPYMPLSMRTLLAADPNLPEETRAAIANGDRDSVGRLVELGLDECEAAEL